MNLKYFGVLVRSARLCNRLETVHYFIQWFDFKRHDRLSKCMITNIHSNFPVFYASYFLLLTRFLLFLIWSINREWGSPLLLLPCTFPWIIIFSKPSRLAVWLINLRIWRCIEKRRLFSCIFSSNIDLYLLQVVHGRLSLFLHYVISKVSIFLRQDSLIVHGSEPYVVMGKIAFSSDISSFLSLCYMVFLYPRRFSDCRLCDFQPAFYFLRTTFVGHVC